MISESDLKALDYDDVLLLPEQSSITSRKNIELTVENKTHHPIFSAPMKGISEPKFIIELDKLGGIGILHRFFQNDEERLTAISNLRSVKNYGIAIGINDWNKELVFVNFAVKNGCKFIVIDTATGHMQRTIDSVYNLNYHRK